MNKYRQRRIDNKLCTLCGIPIPERTQKTCAICAERGVKNHTEWMKGPGRKEAHAQKNKLLRAARKDAVFKHYGGYICSCCGETRKPFLTIDHINNDGYKHRQELGSGGSRLYTWLWTNKLPPGFRVMCCNCNFGRFRNNGVCPHVDVTNFGNNP